MKKLVYILLALLILGFMLFALAIWMFYQLPSGPPPDW